MWKLLLVVLLCIGCADPAPERFYLVETAPTETSIANDDFREFHETWKELIDGASESIELAHFYASNEPGSRLEPIVEAIERAGKRGVTVRFLVDERFYATYPDTLDRLAERKSATVRRLNLRERTGGVLHAKYLVIDRRVACIGSANFDWRALEHIQELGAVVDSGVLAACVLDVFELDWWIAGGSDEAARPTAVSPSHGTAVTTQMASGDSTGSKGQAPAFGEVRVTPVFSPKGLLPSEAAWDLPKLLAWIDGAEEKVWVQVMTFRMTSRDGDRFDELETALRNAAARGVDVRLLVADWGKRSGTIEGLQELTQVDGIQIKMATLPQASQGHIPFARVIHSKYMVVDRDLTWVGSSNWEKGYFYESRNVGLLIEGDVCASRLSQFFLDGWTGPYSYAVDPNEVYEVPKIGE